MIQLFGSEGALGKAFTGLEQEVSGWKFEHLPNPPKEEYCLYNPWEEEGEEWDNTEDRDYGWRELDRLEQNAIARMWW